MTYGVVKQQPTPTPETFDEPVPWADATLADFVRPRVLDRPTQATGWPGTPATSWPYRPARPSVGRSAGSRAPCQAHRGTDAAMLHVYGLSRAEAEHVLDSFFVVAKVEERDLGEYRTKRLVLAAYDALADAAATGIPFASRSTRRPATAPATPSDPPRPH